MKRYKNIIIVAILSIAMFAMALPAQASSADADTLWDAGNEAYANGEYGEAIVAYEELIEMGYENDILYYNLGNAYYKKGISNVDADGNPFIMGELGKAILNYERALKVNPEMDDARYNLGIAHEYTDAPEQFPEGFIPTLWNSMSGAISSNTWTIVSLVALFVTLGLILVYLLVYKRSIRKIAFFTSIVTLLVFILTTAFAISQGKTQTSDNRAIIICNSTQTIHAEPSSKSKRLREESQGVAIEVLQSVDEWTEVKFADGEKGWILSESIEVI